MAFLSPTDGVVALLQEVIERIGSVHVLKEFALHFVFCESIEGQLGFWEKGGMCLLYEVEHDCLWNHVNHRSLDDVVVRVDEEF